MGSAYESEETPQGLAIILVRSRTKQAQKEVEQSSGAGVERRDAIPGLAALARRPGGARSPKPGVSERWGRC